MKIKNISKFGKDLSLYSLKTIYKFSESAEFPLKIGEICNVYGISLQSGILNYLIVPNEGRNPDWYPAELFEVIDGLLPIEFYFKHSISTDSEGMVDAICGYYELVFDKEHNYQLFEREDIAIRIFLKRKNEIDNS